MTDEIKTGGPAFPPHHNPTTHPSGMTLRDWFAGQAMSGMLSGLWTEDSGYVSSDQIARIAYGHADDMLEARLPQTPEARDD